MSDSLFDPIRAAVDAAEAATTARVDQLHAAMDAKAAADAATIADLRAQLATYQPKPQATGLVLGLDLTDFTPAGVAAHRKMVGGQPLSNVRVFFPPGRAPTWTDSQFTNLTGADRPHVSAKTLTEATLRAFIRSTPPKFQTPGKPLRLTYMHEGEADILGASNPTAALAGYLDTYTMIQRVLADEPNGANFEPWKILLRYTQAEDGRPGYKDSWARFVGDQNIPVGMDCYWSGWIKNYWPGAELLAPIVNIGEKTGLRIAVPELGGVTSYVSKKGVVGRQDKDGSGRAAAITETIAYLRTTKIEWANFWCGKGAAGDHHLELFPSNAAAWAAGMAQNPHS